MNLKITRITVLIGFGSDKITLFTELPNACWPYDGEQTAHMEAAVKTGQAYCEKHFAGVPIEVLDHSGLHL